MQAYCGELVLKPVGALLNGNALDAYAGITRASLSILNVNVNLEILVINLETITIGTMQSTLITILKQPSVEIAGHTPV